MPVPGGELPRHLLAHLGIVEHRVDALAPPALEHGAALRLGAGDARAEQALGAGDGGEAQLAAPDRERERDDPCIEQLPQPAHDEIEQPSRSVSVASAFPTSFRDWSCRDQRFDAS